MTAPRPASILGPALSLALLAACGGERPPEFVVQPADALVTAGEPAAFHVEVVGDPTPTLRWQRSDDAGATWLDLGGATAADLTLPATVPADDGALLRVLARSDSGEATSDEAALTVAPVPVKPEIVAGPWVTRGSSRQASVDASRDGHVYRWTVTGGTFGSGATTIDGPVVRFYPDSLSAEVVLGCTARNAAGRTTEAATKTVGIAAALKITSFLAEEGEVAPGQVVHLTAVYSGGPGAVLYGGEADPITSGVRFTSRPIVEDTTFTLRVTNEAGEFVEAALRVGVPAARRPRAERG